MKRSTSIVLVFLVLVATPLLVLGGTVSAQGYGESAYGGRSYDNWVEEDQDEASSPTGETPEDAGQAPGIVIVPDADNSDDSDELQIDFLTPDETDSAIDEVESIDRSDNEEGARQDANQTSHLEIWLSIGAIVLVLVLFLCTLFRRRNKRE